MKEFPKIRGRRNKMEIINLFFKHFDLYLLIVVNLLLIGEIKYLISHKARKEKGK